MRRCLGMNLRCLKESVLFGWAFYVFIGVVLRVVLETTKTHIEPEEINSGRLINHSRLQTSPNGSRFYSHERPKTPVCHLMVVQQQQILNLNTHPKDECFEASKPSK